MKNVIYFLLVTTLLLSCSTKMQVKQIGQLNMVSTRNVNPNLQYQVLTNYSGASQKELKKSKSETVEDAINETVKKIPGGEFLMNVKLYSINNKYYAIEGDVWGIELNNGYRGFKLGTKVIWKTLTGQKTGEIYGIKDNEKCLIKDEAGNIIEMKYDNITKVVD